MLFDTFCFVLFCFTFCSAPNSNINQVPKEVLGLDSLLRFPDILRLAMSLQCFNFYVMQIGQGRPQDQDQVKCLVCSSTLELCLGYLTGRLGPESSSSDRARERCVLYFIVGKEKIQFNSINNNTVCTVQFICARSSLVIQLASQPGNYNFLTSVDNSNVLAHEENKKYLLEINESPCFSRRVTRGGGRGGGLPCFFLKIGKKCPTLE